MGDVVPVDAAEEMAGFDDAAGRAGAQIVEHRAAGAVNAGEAEDIDGDGKAAPGGLGLDAAECAGGFGRKLRILIDPGAVPVAVDAGGGEVADIGQGF